MITPRATLHRTWLPGRWRWWAIACTPAGRVHATGHGRTSDQALQALTEAINQIRDRAAEDLAAQRIARLIHQEDQRRRGARRG